MCLGSTPAYHPNNITFSVCVFRGGGGVHLANLETCLMVTGPPLANSSFTTKGTAAMVNGKIP